MATFKKGTNDADVSGKKGGSVPDKPEDRIARLEEEVGALKAIMRRNGWTVKD